MSSRGLQLCSIAAFALVACKKQPSFADLFDGGGSAAPIVSLPVILIPPEAGPAVDPAQRLADLARAKDWLTDLQWCVAHKATMNPANAGEGDSSTECDDVAEARPKTTDPEIVAVLDDAAALCAFDIPLVTANEALDHLRNGTSQASKLLMCTVAMKEIAKAKAVRPRDARVSRLEARRSSMCR